MMGASLSGEVTLLATTKILIITSPILAFQPGDRGGSHNLVVGPGNRFTHSAFGGAVTGWNNTINGINASVYGGLINRADQGTILGGTNNIASANATTISGGDRNTASGDRVSILGGENNTASAPFANIVGGSNNTASGQYWIIPNPLPGTFQ